MENMITMSNCILCRKICEGLDGATKHLVGLNSKGDPSCPKASLDFVISVDQRDSLDDATMKVEMTFNPDGIGNCNKEGCTSKLCGIHFDRVTGLPKK